jgi:hypothetical protein
MRLALATAFILIALPAPARAQRVMDALSLKSGAHARILGPAADSRYTLITVESTSRDSLRYTLARSLDPKSLSWQQVNKMDVSIGSHRHFGRGLGIGLLVGAVGGAILGASAEPGQDFTKGLDAAIGGVVGGVLGGITGGAVGLAWRGENWVPVAVPNGTLVHR